MTKLKNLLLLVCALALPAAVWAAAPSGYYKSAEGKNKSELLKALCQIVGSHENVGYNGLWTVYKTSDVTSDGYVWDMYSTSKFTPGKKQCGSYTNVGDCYNREHSFPKSWFDDASPMYSDAYHIYPTDGKVNGQRSNYPYGECANGTYLPAKGSIKPLGRLGKCTFPGYSGTVFEPDDQYKGDFARTYFYMAAAYNDRFKTWDSPMLAGNNYPCYTTWAINLLMKWHREDPVSQKEINRNEAVSNYQENRNPFIDHPELAEYIWGNRTNEGWVPGGAAKPNVSSPVDGTVYNLGTTSLNRQIKTTVTVKASALTENFAIEVDDPRYFSVSKSILDKDELCSAEGAKFDIYFTSGVAGDFSTSISVESGDIAFSIIAKASALDGIPAQQASGIGIDGFTAHWTNISGTAEYLFSLFESDATTPVAGYPVKVAASAQKLEVTGLNYSTDYYYMLSLTDGTLKSNKVKVTTADPTPILALIYPESGIAFNTLPGVASEPMSVQVYTEYVTEQIDAKISGNFEISRDKENWSQHLVIDPEGEYIYVRCKAVVNEGTYTGLLTLATASFEGDEVDVVATVGYPKSFIEDFEGIETGGYWSTAIDGHACLWRFGDVGVWGDPNSRGSQSARFGKTDSSYIEMMENKTSGAGTISFYAARFGSDDNATIEVKYSVNDGETWTLLKEIEVSATVLTAYTIPANIAGAVRLKFEQTAGKRLNIDDIEISDYSSVARIDATSWDVYPTAGGVMVEGAQDCDVIIYTLDGVEVALQHITADKAMIAVAPGAYVVTLDNTRGKKVILK